MGLFLLSVCHIVIILDNDPANTELWNYIKILETLKWNIPDIASPSTPSVVSVTPNNNFKMRTNEYLPDLGALCVIIIHTNCLLGNSICVFST